MNNSTQIKFNKDLDELLHPYIIALSIPMAKLLLGKRKKYLTKKQIKDLKQDAIDLINLL